MEGAMASTVIVNKEGRPVGGGAMSLRNAPAVWHLHIVDHRESCAHTYMPTYLYLCVSKQGASSPRSVEGE